MRSSNRSPILLHHAILSPDTSTYRWAIVGMLWFLCFFNYADRLAIYSVFPVLQQEYGFSKSDLGLIGAAFTWVYAAVSPLAGHVGDRYSRKGVLLTGLYVWSLITGLTAQCTKVWQFVLVRGSEGLGETFYFPASMALISDYHTPATRSRAIGMHQTSIYAGTIFGGALAGWMGQRYGWQSPFWTLALAGIVLGLVLRRIIREPSRNEAERSERREHAEDLRVSDRVEAFGAERGPSHGARNTTPLDVAEQGMERVQAGDAPSMPAEPEPMPLVRFLAEFARTPTAVLLVAAYFGANLVGFVFLTWMPTFLKEKFGLNLAWAGLGATFFIQAASMGGSLLGGVAADHRIQGCLEGRIQVQALAILVGAPFVFLCGYTRSPWWLIVAMTLFGLCKGVYDANLTAAFYDVIPPARRSTATGLMNLVGWVGAGLGAIGIGVAADHHVPMSTSIASTAIIYIAVAAILYAAGAFTAERDIRRVRQGDGRATA